MNLGWIQIKKMWINLDHISGIQFDEDAISIFSHGSPLAQFKRGIGKTNDFIGSSEFDTATKELQERLGDLQLAQEEL